MSDNNLINLSKDLGIVLTKNNIPNVVVQVGTTVDVSGSAQSMYVNGIIQRLLDRIFVLAYKFDDNRLLDSWAFANQSTELEPITEKMFGNYVDRYILKNSEVDLWGGTQYLPAMSQILEHYFPTSTPVPKAVAPAPEPTSGGFFGKIAGLFGGKPAAQQPQAFAPQAAAEAPPDIPAYIVFTTDGENSMSERSQIINLLNQTKDKKIYWQFVGITDGQSPSFGFLEKLANDFPNVGFYNAMQVDKVSNEKLYSELLNPKFVAWYKQQTKV